MSRLAGYGGAVYVGTQVVENCEDAWNELVDGDVTASLDTTDYQVGSGSAKFVCAAGIANGDIIATEEIALNLSSYTEILFWIKSSVGVAAGDLAVLISETAQCGGSPVTFSVPALTANVWKLCKVTGTMSGLDTAISVGLKLVANDPGAFNVWIDHISASATTAGVKSWTLDKTMEVADTTGFDSSGHRTFSPTVDQWSGSFEGYKDGTPLTIGTMVLIELQESSTITQQYRGSAVLTSVHPSVSVDGLVLYSYDFQGSGALEYASA
ncbi:MAG: hypothetical protein KKB38_20140 [Gammaproteobacteria bacterium]|nr:hypothetical protein [Gammaproteobacteria bacterium]